MHRTFEARRLIWLWIVPGQLSDGMWISTSSVLLGHLTRRLQKGSLGFLRVSVRGVRGVCNKDSLLVTPTERCKDLKGERRSTVITSAQMHGKSQELQRWLGLQLRETNDLGIPRFLCHSKGHRS